MKSILLIGLGRFGRHIAIKLDELHHQVMAVDKEDTRVDAVLPFVTNAQIGDATNEDFLSSRPKRRPPAPRKRAVWETGPMPAAGPTRRTAMMISKELVTP